jgi:hypothetical protein
LILPFSEREVHMRINIASAAIAAVSGPAASVARDFTMGAAEFAYSQKSSAA